MKYLKSRTLFIENRKLDFNKENISEALQNDITWGDSLVGRLMASIFRMGKLGVDMVSIKGLLTRLENVINQSVIDEVSKNNNEFNELKENIKKKSIKEGIVDTISEKPKKTSDVVDEYIDEYGDDYIYSIINELPNDLKNILLYTIDQNNIQKENKIDLSLYKNIIKNLQSLKGILSSYGDIEIDGEQPSNDKNNDTENNNIKKILNDIFNNKIEDKDKEKYINILNNSLKKQKDIKISNDIKKALQKLTNLTESIKIQSNEKNVISAFTKIKNDIGILQSSKEKGLGIDVNFINEILSNNKKEDVKKSLKYVYNNIYLYHIGKNIGVSEPSKLYEGIEIILDKTKSSTFSEKMSRFIKRTLQFEGENLYGSFGDMGKYLSEFNKSILYIFDSISNNGESSTTNNDISTKIEVEKDNSEYKIENDKILKDGDPLSIDEISDTINDNEISEQVKDLSKIDSDIKEYSKNTNIDLIEVVRIFSKANKKMVVNNIPSVRTGGKITVARSNNYEKLDGGSVSIDGSGGGPYRNKKLFNMWNDGVLKIMSKYRDVLKNANIYDEDGNKIKPKYPITKFMSDALDDSKLFSALAGKSGGSGYQSKYLEQYFGIKSDEFKDTHNRGTIESEDLNEIIDECKYNENVNIIYVDGTINDKKVSNIPIYLIYLTKKGNNTLCKISTSDAFLKAYTRNYNVRNRNSKNKIFFTLIDNIKVGSSYDIKILETMRWEDNNVVNFNINNVRKIEKINEKRSLNRNRLDNDIYPSDSIEKIIEKLS